MTGVLDSEPPTPRVRDAAPPGSAGPGVVAPAGSALVALAVAAALALLPADTAAQGSETPSLSFDGFGTFGGVYSSEDRADYVWNTFRPDGPGRSEDVSPDVDSRVGAQLTADLVPGLKAVVQVITEQNEDDNYAPSLEWGYLEYAVTRDFTVRAGRTTLPTFLVSDFRKVSFANPWVRPPVELYGLNPVFTLDGVDARYRFHTGEWTSTLQATFGRTEPDLPGGSSVEAEPSLHVDYSLERGALRTHLGAAWGKLTVDAFDPLFEAVRQFGSVGEVVADRNDVDDTSFHLATLGAEYDPGRWFVMGEVGMIDLNSVLANSAAGYVSGGYRVGQFTVFTTYSRLERTNSASLPGLPAAAFPPDAAETAANLNGFMESTRADAPEQQDFAVGGRWDVGFVPGVALKAQVDFVDMLGDSPGTFLNRQPDFERGGSAQLFSLATAFVF